MDAVKSLIDNIVYPVPDLEGKTNFHTLLNNGYKIFSQKELNSEEVSQINSLINATEKRFHLYHGSEPVKNDKSKPLNIVMLECNREYLRRTGDDKDFDGVNTSGIYWEGNPADEANQPVIYFCRTMGKLRLEVLEHEFWHYLDGKYIKYGEQSFFNGNEITWWTEGSAIYNTANQAIKKDLKNELKTFPRDKLPILFDIISKPFQSSNDEYRRVYLQSVWVHAFLDSNIEMRKIRSQLETALRGEGEYNDPQNDFIKLCYSIYNETLASPFRDYLIKQWDSINPEFGLPDTENQKSPDSN